MFDVFNMFFTMICYGLLYFAMFLQCFATFCFVFTFYNVLLFFLWFAMFFAMFCYGLLCFCYVFSSSLTIKHLRTDSHAHSGILAGWDGTGNPKPNIAKHSKVYQEHSKNIAES